MSAAVPDRAPRGVVLVDVARAAIGESLGLMAPPGHDDAWLLEKAATFVTLHKLGDLRGCIGSIDARRPLGADVAHNARRAAFNDPRFPPVTRDEFDALEV